MKLSKGLSFLLAAALCLCMATPVSAAEKTVQEKRRELTEDLIDIYFNQGYNPSYAFEITYYGVYLRTIRNLNGHQTRNLIISLDVIKDSTVAEFVKLNVTEDATLTVEKDMTLTVNGELNVAGKLVNHGTIILNAVANDYSQMEVLDSILRNTGTVVNHGVIEIHDARVNNLGRFENKGEIVVNKGGGKNAALRNGAKQEKTADEKDKLFLNTGTIRLQNASGFGLENVKGSVFDNKGSITRTAGSVIDGVITGNQPAVKEKP